MLILCNTQQNLIWNYAQSVSDGWQYMHVCMCIKHNCSSSFNTLLQLVYVLPKKKQTEQLSTRTCRCRWSSGIEWERWIESGIQLYIHVLNKCICIQSEIMFSILSYRSLGWTQLIMWCVYVHTYIWILKFWVSEWRTKCVRCTKQMLNIYNTTTLARTHTIALRYLNCDWNALKAFVLMKFTNHIVQHSILACWNFQCNSISHWEFCTPISTYSSTYCST